MSTITRCLGALAVATAAVPAQDSTRPETERASFHTYSQRAWGETCAADDSPACRLAEHFTTLFPTGLVLGDGDGIDADDEHALVFGSAAAVGMFLPIAAERPIATLDRSLTDPLPDERGLGGALAGELLAAKLNVLFDAHGLSPSSMDGTTLGELEFVDGVADAFVGHTVRDVIALADGILAGRDDLAIDELGASTRTVDVDDDGEPDVSARDVTAALATFNANYADGTTDAGHLSPPVRPLEDDGEPDDRGGR